MNIKNEEELSNILGMAFANYANRVARGEVAPYRAFIDGVEAVTVQVSLVKGVIQVENSFVEPLIQPVNDKREWINDELTGEAIGVKIQVESPVLEAIEKSVVVVQPINTELSMMKEAEETVEKPKTRKRKA